MNKISFLIYSEIFEIINASEPWGIFPKSLTFFFFSLSLENSFMKSSNIINIFI